MSVTDKPNYYLHLLFSSYFAANRSHPPPCRVTVLTYRFLTSVKKAEIVLYGAVSAVLCSQLTCPLSCILIKQSCEHCEEAGSAVSLLLSVMAGLYSPAEQRCFCNSFNPTFDHSIGCNGRVVLSVFFTYWLHTKEEANQHNMARYFINNKRLRPAPTAHMHILQSSATHLPSFKSIWQTVFVLCKGQTYVQRSLAFIKG